MLARAVRRLAVAIAMLFSAVATAWGEPATVHGARSLYVREGPGTESRIIATLPEGARVEAESLHGAWARVHLPDGRSGYAHSRYLEFPQGRPKSTAQQSPAEPAARMLAEDLEGAEESEAAELPPVPTAAVPQIAGDSATAGRIDRRLARIEAALESLESRLSAPTPPPAPDAQPKPETDSEAISGSGRFTGWGWLLIGTGLGWVMGSAWGRHQERNRRVRVRI